MREFLRRSVSCLAVRGSPDPARRLTEGLQGQRLVLIQGRPPVAPTAGSGDPRRARGDLRSRCARVSRPRTTFDRRSPRAAACANSGRPTVAPTAGSGDLAVRGSPDPARRLTEGLQGQRLVLIQGDQRSRPRRGREIRRVRSPRAAACANSGETSGRTHGGVGRPAPSASLNGIGANARRLIRCECEPLHDPPPLATAVTAHRPSTPTARPNALAPFPETCGRISR